MPRPTDEREIQELLRNAAIVVLLALFVAIVLVVLAMPFLTDREPNVTLLLGLGGSTITAALALLGVQLALWRRPPDA